MGIESRVVLLGEESLSWDFSDRPPSIYAPVRRRSYNSGNAVDPFPCYPHELLVVKQMVEMVEAKFPIKDEPYYYVCKYEMLGRTNAHAGLDYVYEDSKHVGYDPSIWMSGKRTPPHPAVTRYLVAHEYGHLVQLYLEDLRGIDNRSHTTTDMDKQYMEMRPGSDNRYGGGRWHSNIGEMIANDFRICVCEIEPEFWPHPKFKHPHECPDIQEFWAKAVEENIQALKRQEEKNDKHDTEN